MTFDRSPDRRGQFVRRLDLMLAEELAVNHRLVRWLLCKCFDEAIGEIVESATASGADLVVDATSIDGRRRRLLIATRLDTVVDQTHAERSRGRADRATRAGLPTRAVIVAPAAYLASRSIAVRSFHAEMSIDAIAAELRGQAGQLVGELARRLTWRADALDVLRSVRSSPTTDRRRGAATSWFVDRATVDAMAADERVDADGPPGEHRPTFDRATSAIVELSSWLAAGRRRLMADPATSSPADGPSATARARADGHPSVS